MAVQTIKIRNKRTGEVKEIPITTAQDFGINPNDVLSRAKAQEQLQMISEGLDPEVESHRRKKELEQGGSEGAELTEAERKNQNLAKTGLRALKNVQQLIEKDPDLLTKQITPGKFKSRTFDSALFNAINTYLRIQTGAAAPEEEVRRYMSSLGPTFGDSPEDITFKIDQLRTSLVQEGGVPEDKADELFPVRHQLDGSDPKYQGSMVNPEGLAVQGARANAAQMNQPVNPLDRLLLPVAQGPVGDGAEALLGLLAPNVKNVAQRSAHDQPVSGDQLVGAGGDLLSTALPFARIGKLGLAAKGALAGATKGITTPDQTGGERVQSGALQALLGGLLGAIPQGASAAKSNLTLKGVGAQRDAAIVKAKELRFSGDEIAQAAKEYLENDPTAKNVANKILPSIEGKQIALPDLMKKIGVWNDAYTQAGRVGKSAEAGLTNVLAQKAKELVAKDAPKIAEANKKFQRVYGVKSGIKKAAYPLSIAAGGGFGGSLIQALLGGRD